MNWFKENYLGMKKVNIKNYIWYESIHILLIIVSIFLVSKIKTKTDNYEKNLITTQHYKIHYYPQFLTTLQIGTHLDEPIATIGKLQSYIYRNEGIIFKLIKSDNSVQINTIISFDIDTKAEQETMWVDPKEVYR
jgi:hypothetical protein